jgi:spermidine/putrescine transport system substrate-binding protein
VIVLNRKLRAVMTAAIAAGIAAAPLPSVSALEVSDPGYYDAMKGQNISLNVYNWGEYISDGSEGSVDVNAEFEKLTGIKVNYTTFATNEELYAKLQSGAVNYDIIIPSDYMIARMIREGLVQKLDLSQIPALSNIDPDYMNAAFDPTGEYSVPYTWGTVGIIYNTTKITEPVDSWEILWDEKYKGDILMFSNPRDALMIAEKKLGYSMNTSDENEIRAAFEELKAQKPLVQSYVMDEIFDKMGSGEAAVAPYYAGDAITMIDDNPDLAFVSPKEGTNTFIDSICIPADAANVQAAHMYINFLCEPEVAAANIEAIGYSTPNTAAFALLDEETQNSPISYPSQEIMDKAETFLVLPDETNALIDQLWTSLLSTSASADEKKEQGGGFSPVWIVLIVALGVLLVLVGKKKKQKTDAAGVPEEEEEEEEEYEDDEEDNNQDDDVK